MKKVLVCMLTAVLLITGCGGAASAGSNETKETQAEAVQETVEEGEEEAEAPAEGEEAEAPAEGEEAEASAEGEEAAEALVKAGEAVDSLANADEADEAPAEAEESDAISEEKEKDILGKAEEVQNMLGAYVSTSGLEEADEYSSGELKEYHIDIYTLLIPSAWEEQEGFIMVENVNDRGSIITLQAQDLSMYGQFDDATVEQVFQTYESMDKDSFESTFNMENVELSDFERMTLMDGQKSTVASFKGSISGLEGEGILVCGIDTINTRLIIAILFQTVDGQKSHFNDFKKFLGTMTY